MSFLCKKNGMQIVVLEDSQNAEWTHSFEKEGVTVIAIAEPGAFMDHKDADVYADLRFEYAGTGQEILLQLPSKPVFVHAVSRDLPSAGNFIRLNAWPGFSGRPVWEAASGSATTRARAEEIAAHYGKTITWVPDQAGLVTPRILSMIINEAFLAAEEGVSTPSAIDTAMKLGTNYPYGPFEWAGRIGTDNICRLLETLGAVNNRYLPCRSLREAGHK